MGALADAAPDGGEAEADFFPVGGEAFCDLAGELAGGCEDEAAALAGVYALGGFVEFVEDGEGEGGGFAGAGLGAAEEVSALEEEGDGLGLDGGGGGVVELVEDLF